MEGERGACAFVCSYGVCIMKKMVSSGEEVCFLLVVIYEVWMKKMVMLVCES